jgi:hypothetical protein
MWFSFFYRIEVRAGSGQKVQSYLQQKSCSLPLYTGGGSTPVLRCLPIADISAPLFLHTSWVSGREVTRPFTFATGMLFQALFLDLTSHLLLLRYCHPVANNVGNDLWLKVMSLFCVDLVLGSSGCHSTPAIGLV